MKSIAAVIATFFLLALVHNKGACAFSVASRGASTTALRAVADYEVSDGEGKINLKVDLESEKVATMDSIAKGKKVYCRCWLSGTFPLCDGTHAKHNAATGDNVGPLIVSIAKPE